MSKNLNKTPSRYIAEILLSSTSLWFEIVEKRCEIWSDSPQTPEFYFRCWVLPKNRLTTLDMCSLNVPGTFPECSLNVPWFLRGCVSIWRYKHTVPPFCQFLAHLQFIIMMEALCDWTRSSTPGIRRLVLLTLVLGTHVCKLYSASTLVLFLSASCSWDGGSRASAQLLLNAPWMFPECSLNVPRMFPGVRFWPLRSLNVPWMFPECSPNVPQMFPECSLNVPWMFSETFC